MSLNKVLDYLLPHEQGAVNVLEGCIDNLYAYSADIYGHSVIYTDSKAFYNEKVRLKKKSPLSCGISWRQNQATKLAYVRNYKIYLLKYFPVGINELYRVWIFDIFTRFDFYVGTFLWCEKGVRSINPDDYQISTATLQLENQ